MEEELKGEDQIQKHSFGLLSLIPLNQATLKATLTTLNQDHENQSLLQPISEPVTMDDHRQKPINLPVRQNMVVRIPVRHDTSVLSKHG